MIESFGNRLAEDLFYDRSSRDVRRFATELRRVALRNRLGSTWWGFIDVAPGDRYGIRVDGPGHDASKLLVDPWALAIDGTVDWLSNPNALRLGSGIDSGPYVPRSVVVDQRFDWGSSMRPRTPWSETIIYEVHVRVH